MPQQNEQPNNPRKPSIEIAPISDIPFAKVDLDKLINPFPAIIQAPEFSETRRFFSESPAISRSLLPEMAQALLYTVIRNFRPHHVVEIGTYQGGTTEALARAILANGLGTLHTASPFDAARFIPVYHQWPEVLRRNVRYYQVDSMALFMRLDQQRIRPSIVLVDGNHDFEFATFDILAAAQRLTRGGFIFVDNVAQSGPYQAVVDFMAMHPEWHDCGARSPSRDNTKAFDRDRPHIENTEFIVLRAPFNHFVGSRPETFGEHEMSHPTINGIRFSIAGLAVGTLHVQCILRAFSETKIEEVIGEATRVIRGDVSDIEITFDKPIIAEVGADRYRAEPWLVWFGDAPLPLRTLPTPF